MGKIKTACVIDDDEIYSYSVDWIIKTNELAEKILFFSNGKLAIDFFIENLNHPENLPDVVLLDINMPVLDGWQFMDEYVKLKTAIDKKIIFYMVSSTIDEDDYTKSRMYTEIVDFIVKPITISALTDIADKFE
ncbi:response regulator [Pedobacter rhodius]|uniref:Response regulator n=1 Tax=Pedobacter rhodius TaxID=3004098 RepID=A0ABT4KVX5_9SPHI|nr:response regulator [Pedobacter sp. SJ11]MCZ4222925.1 response regulator [Pedobacter sp. SJ11]